MPGIIPSVAASQVVGVIQKPFDSAALLAQVEQTMLG
jgi:hypothetical protein